MAYIPPHKRLSINLERPSQTQELLVRRFNHCLRPHKHNVIRSGKIVYSPDAISVWCAIGLDGNNQFPSSVHLEPISVEALERRTGEKPLVLVNSHLAKENDEVKDKKSRSPWEFVAEVVLPDLLSSFAILRFGMECQKLEGVKPTLVARFGKILFNGSNSMSLESVREGQVLEASLKQLNRLFYTNIPSTYMEKMVSVVAPKIGVDFDEEKDIYHVKLSDSGRPGSTISCKCCITEDKMLELYKVELNQVRHLVVDISCLDKDLDLRLMLCSKRILTALTDHEMQSIRNLISSAVIDPEAKGGLRWPLEKTYSRNRYGVIGVWHTKVKSYRSSSLRLKLRHADRFDFKTATGEATMEITLKLKSIVSKMQEEKIEFDSVRNMFQDNLKLIWENFLSCEKFST